MQEDATLPTEANSRGNRDSSSRDISGWVPADASALDRGLEAQALGSTSQDQALHSDLRKGPDSMDVDETFDRADNLLPLSLEEKDGRLEMVNPMPTNAETSEFSLNPEIHHTPSFQPTANDPAWQDDQSSKRGVDVSADPSGTWRLLESTVQNHAYALCEQLRLIIEPTMASRLKGDYRTGKRLNVKKIIPYIASDYSKDKIWLRRTKPSRREYQVLLALDDSRSMSQSHSVDLAFQTLALVTMALSKLEVGDLAIARFGTTTELVHDFSNGPFTATAGAKVLEAFHFEQTSTDMLKLLRASLELLATARERRSFASNSAGQLWQLEVIISDGICQNHEELLPLLRQALEQRIMVVFVVLDALASAVAAGTAQSSITTMNQVGYKEVNGRMELVLDRYLDTFPFEYYILVEDVAALPDVLSRTLRQFFATVSEG